MSPFPVETEQVTRMTHVGLITPSFERACFPFGPQAAPLAVQGAVSCGERALPVGRGTNDRQRLHQQDCAAPLRAEERGGA